MGETSENGRYDLDRLTAAVKRQMPERRWEHTRGVMQEAVRLAERFGGDPAKAELAALLHDYCKYWPIERQRQVLAEAGELGDLSAYGGPLLHGPAAAVVVREELGVDDPEVLDAVRFHTSGRVHMTKLDKIICLADYIEPGRDFPDVHKIRRLAEHSLERALLAGLDSTIRHLLDRQAKIYPLTVEARNWLLTECEREGQEGVHDQIR